MTVKLAHSLVEVEVLKGVVWIRVGESTEESVGEKGAYSSTIKLAIQLRHVTHDGDFHTRRMTLQYKPNYERQPLHKFRS